MEAAARPYAFTCATWCRKMSDSRRTMLSSVQSSAKISSDGRRKTGVERVAHEAMKATEGQLATTRDNFTNIVVLALLAVLQLVLEHHRSGDEEELQLHREEREEDGQTIW